MRMNGIWYIKLYGVWCEIGTLEESFEVLEVLNGAH